MRDVTKHESVKELFKTQGRPMHFNEAEDEKCTDMLSDSTLQLMFKNLPYIEFSCSTNEE